MKNSTLRRTGAILAAGALALSMASCSGGQSTKEACSIAEDTMTGLVSQSQEDAQTALQEAMEGGDADFSQIFEPTISALDKAGKKITNEEVKEALSNFTDEYKTFAGTIEDVDFSAFSEISDLSNIDPSDPDALAKAEELQKKGEELQKQAQDLQDATQEQGEKLTAAGTKLDDVCNK